MKILIESEEIEFIKSKFPRDKKLYKFSHQDMHNGNIFYSEDKVIRLIDFEYSCFNVISYDIGDYFMES